MYRIIIGNGNRCIGETEFKRRYSDCISSVQSVGESFSLIKFLVLHKILKITQLRKSYYIINIINIIYNDDEPEQRIKH